MATTSGSFTGVNDTIVHPVMDKGEDITVAISGTYDMDIELQRELGAQGSGAWETIKNYNTANATVSDGYTVERQEEHLRLFVRTDSSGTATVSLSDSDQELDVIYDKQGNVVYTVKQSGIDFPGSVNGVPKAERLSLDPSQKVRYFDDFLGIAIDARTSSTAGSGTGNAAATIVANSDKGEITMHSASDDGAHGANGSAMSLDVTNFKANMGGLYIEARLKIDDVSEAAVFVGFSDTISTTVELPIFASAGDLDSDAANAAGVGYDVDATTDEWFHGGVKANTDTALTHSGSAPTDDTYVTVRAEIDSSGRVRGFIDGTAIGGWVNSAVTITTSLTPYIVIANRSANQVIITLDYWDIGCNR